MKKNKLTYLLAFLTTTPFFTIAQDTIGLKEVKIISYLGKQSLLRAPAAVAVLDSSQLKLQANTSLLSAVNTIPGVRMEERSPGSYRLSLRGSLLRSPFGVRNVKVYLDEFPLTDAGCNTYINVLALNAVNKIEVLKGPDGSLFGANSGGVVTINTGYEKDKISAELAGGSYGLFKENISFAKKIGNNDLHLAQSYQQADGYRDNSRMRRIYFQAADQWNYNARNFLKLLVFYSDLYYQTPGGLTKAQYDANPKQARPATPTLPSAATQKAAVYNKMLFGGITHSAMMGKYVEHVISVFGTTVNFKNPFITNYETRKEDTYGARTYFVISNNKSNATTKLEYDLGAEWQQTRSTIHNYANMSGNKGALMASGRIVSDQHFFFNRLRVDIGHKFIAEAGVSLNYYSYRFRDTFQLSNRFKPQWMPRLALSYAVVPGLTIRTSLSKGYSPPTTAEIRPSDNNIYPNLQPETGTNIEFGARYFSAPRFWADLSVYNYRLKNAIVRQQNALGAEYFVNAGGTYQTGVELQTSYRIISPLQKQKLINKLEISNSSTYNYFKFRDYVIGTSNYSNNYVTGLPKYTFISSVLLEMHRIGYLFVQHNYTSEIFLNDANTVQADHYNLMQLKLGHTFVLPWGKIELYGGIDNLLNEKYSLGNDLNAAGNRFFNTAAERNYFAGIVLVK